MAGAGAGAGAPETPVVAAYSVPAQLMRVFDCTVSIVATNSDGKVSSTESKINNISIAEWFYDSSSQSIYGCAIG